ncbi:MAG TPA: TonB-dependent receptor [Rhodanobacteraceae bacterium]
MTTRSNGRRLTTTQRLLTASLLAALAAPAVYAQAITGGLFGQVPAGEPITVRVTGTESGLVRTLQPNAKGVYRTRGLSPGQYTVNIIEDGETIATRNVIVSPNANVTVAPLAASTAAAAVAQNAQQLASVNVSATSLASATEINPIDVSTPELVSNFSMQLVNQLPVGRSPESIALLQSNVEYDDQTTGSIMMGGATPAGNRYFINGFDTTDDDTSIGGHSFPPEAVDTTTVVSDGFTGSWTNAMGGIMASTIRQGTNKYKAGYSLYFTPPTSRLLEPRGHDLVAPNGQLYHFASANRHDASFTQYLWGSGPIVKNKLFFFALVSNNPPSQSRGVGRQSESFGSGRNKEGMLNLTWNITENQSLNVFGEGQWSTSSYNSYALTQNYDPNSKGKYLGWSGGLTNQHFLVGNYEYNITPDLSLVLMGGYVGETTGSRLAGQYIDQPFVEKVDPVTQIGTVLSNNTTQFYGVPRRFYKRGFTGKLNWDIGTHRITAGGEYYKYAVTEVFESNPHGYWILYDRPGATLGNGETVPGNGEYADEYIRVTGGTVPTVAKAAYIQDFWNVTDDVVLYGALRDDIYNYKNTDAVTFIRFNKLSPRLGASWDVDGDGTFKIGGNIGKYNQQLPLNFTFGVAGVDLTADKYYTYTGLDPVTQAPTGLTQIGAENIEHAATPPSSDQLSVKNLKSNSSLEYNIYAQKVLNSNWTGLAEFSGSKLLRAINETCDGAAVDAYAHAHGYPNYDLNNEFTNACIEFNPGSDLVIKRDFAGNGQEQVLTVPNSYYGMPKVPASTTASRCS